MGPEWGPAVSLATFFPALLRGVGYKPGFSPSLSARTVSFRRLGRRDPTRPHVRMMERLFNNLCEVALSLPPLSR